MTRAAVVIPVYNRARILERTLAALTAQDHDDLVVVVADDGSEEDIRGLVGAWKPPFESLYVRQERDGFGAGRARNLGARSVEADVLVFLDSDGITAPDHVSRHVSRHAGNLPSVVIGRRVHLVGADLDPSELARGTVDLRGLSQLPRSDFRTVLSRRTNSLQRTDEGYRAFVSSNLSLPSALFHSVGGFDERFRWWGSEDTELGWRLWQEGADFVDDKDNVIFHQVDADTAGGEGGRRRAREMNRGLLTSLVPHRFYRKGVPVPLPEVPKFSVVVYDVPPGAPQEMWSALNSQTEPDFEALFVADPREHDPFSGAASGERRVTFAADLEAALRSSRGEFVLFISGHAAPRNSLLQNVRRRLEQRPAADALTFGVATPDGPLGRRGDVATVGGDWGYGHPIGFAVRRRPLVRAVVASGTVAKALSALLEGAMHTRQPLIAVPSGARAHRPQGFTFSLTRTPAVDRSQPRPGPDSTPERRPGIRYVGWVGKDNLGDEAMLEAVAGLMDWGEVSVRGEAGDLLLLGGGTLINRNLYLEWLTERDSPRIERAVFGTGVASPEFWDVTEDTDRWLEWLDTCCYVGVRGPRSAQTLVDWGYRGHIEVCGDPALALTPPVSPIVDGSVIVAPAWTNGELWGGSDMAVYQVLADLVADLIAEGRPVTLMSSHPTDDRPILLIRDRLGPGPPVGYLAGYEDTGRTLEAIASSSVVVGERLHACVLAAAAGRPFVAVEYRPKLRDFASSIGMEEFVIRTDRLTTEALVSMVDSTTRHDLTHMRDAVAGYRSRLQAASDLIRDAVVR